MCAGMMSWQTGGIGLWSLSFSPENIHRRRGSAGRKSETLISSQTTLWVYSAQSRAYLRLIGRVVRFFWVTACLSLKSHQGYPPFDLTAPGKLYAFVYLSFCTCHTPASPMAPEHPKTCENQSAADVALCKRGLTTNDMESIRGGGAGECCGGC